MKFAHKQSQTSSPSYHCMSQVGLKSLDIYSSYSPETKIWACLGQITPSELIKFALLQSQIRSLQYQCTYEVWWKSIDIYSSYHPQTKIWVCLRQITPSKFDEICPLAIPNQISTISMYIPILVKIHWYLLRNKKNWACLGQITPLKIEKICPLAIPNQISEISMHIPNMAKIHWCLLKLSSGNKNIGMSQADNSVKIWRNLPISNPKPDLYNINAHTKFGENPLMFTLSYQPETKYGRTMDGLTDTRTSNVKP